MSASSTPAGPPAFSFKPIRQPMLWAVLAYALGIVAGIYAWRPALWWIVAGLAFLAAGMFFANRRIWLAKFLALGALFLAGAFHIQMRGTSPRLDTSIRPFADGREVQVTAHALRDGRMRPDAFGEPRETVDLETEQLETADGLTAFIHSGIR